MHSYLLSFELPVAVTLTLSLIAIWIFLGFYQPFWLVRVAQLLLPELIFFVKTDSPFVALTLDDGPDGSVTPQVLRILGEEGVRATWFVMGKRVQEFPQEYEDILRRQHQVANHFWDQTPTVLMGKKRFHQDLARTEQLIDQRDCPRLLRPASGWFRPWIFKEARKLNYSVVLGSAYTSDPMRPPNAYMTWALIKMARPGSIIVLHVGPGRKHTPQILPEIIRGIRAKGLNFVTVSELLTSGDEATK